MNWCRDGATMWRGMSAHSHGFSTKLPSTGTTSTSFITSAPSFQWSSCRGTWRGTATRWGTSSSCLYCTSFLVGVWVHVPRRCSVPRSSAKKWNGMDVLMGNRHIIVKAVRYLDSFVFFCTCFIEACINVASPCNGYWRYTRDQKVASLILAILSVI